MREKAATFIALGAVALAACNPGNSSAGSNPPPSPSASVRAPAISEQAGGVTLVASSATYTGNGAALEQCTDVHVVVPPDRVDEGKAILARMFEGDGEKTLGHRLARTCAETFAPRIVLARCTTVDRKMTTTAQYYDPRSLMLGDYLMKACTENGGDWTTIDKSDPAFQDAVRARAQSQ